MTVISTRTRASIFAHAPLTNDSYVREVRRCSILIEITIAVEQKDFQYTYWNITGKVFAVKYHIDAKCIANDSNDVTEEMRLGLMRVVKLKSRVEFRIKQSKRLVRKRGNMIFQVTSILTPF
jgi:hypothetical protein